MSKWTLPAWIAGVLLLSGGPVLAVDNGFYLGGAVGGATTEVSEDGVTFDENDFAWKIYGGYQFLSFLAVEAAYRNFGEPSTTILGSDVKVEPTGFDVSAVAGLPLGPVYAFGKVSALFWDADLIVDGEKFSDDGTDLGVGIGLSIDIAKIRVRGEIEYFDVQDGVLMYTVGGAWLF